MGVLPDVRGLNATDLFENTKILIELEKRAPQFKRSEGDPSPRHHINWPRTRIAMESVAALAWNTHFNRFFYPKTPRTGVFFEYFCLCLRLWWFTYLCLIRPSLRGRRFLPPHDLH